MKIPITFFLFILCFNMSFAQDRLKPGAIYEQGQEIFAPMVGYKGIVPDGWFGTLPQEEEVFLMIPNGNVEGYMFINAHRMDLEELKQDWADDFSLTDQIVISIAGKPIIDGNRMQSEFVVTGSQKPFKGYGVAIDGGHGFTLSLSLLAPVEKYEDYKENFDQLIASSSVVEPTIGTLYGDFNWPEFLKSKYLMSYLSIDKYREQNEVWLCPDGTFKSKIKNKGALAIEKSEYVGKKKGTWRAEGIGETGKLFLTFSKNTPLELKMEIKDDKIFVNGGRFFALENNQCK